MARNGAVFVMLGLEMPHVLQRVDGHSRWHLLGQGALLTFAVFAMRLAWTVLLTRWSRHRRSAAGEGLPNVGLVLSARRRELQRLQDGGRLGHAELQDIAVALDLAEMALDRLDWWRS